VISLLALALVAGDPQPDIVPGCEPDAPIRDPAVCKPLYDDGTYVIQNVESVAVGTKEEMKRVREMTRHCELANRIDGVGAVDVSVYDIVNADTVSRACVIGWINENAPNLAFSEEKYKQRLKDAPLLED
jgi:hypothetical protein